MACPGTGAHPTPEAVGSNILLDLGVSALSSRLGLARAKGLISAAELVLGSMSVSDLCAINPSDPGPATVEMLKWDLIGGFLPGSAAGQGTLGKWLWDSAIYHFFQISCVCNDASTQPPITVVTAPPGSQDYPTDPPHQPQLTRIENNQSTSSTALNTLYLGLQDTNQQIADLRQRAIEQILVHSAAGQWSMSGEGYQDLNPDFAQVGTGVTDRFGLVVQLTAIPSTVARRGTTYQRLYGVGSIEWDGSPVNYPFRRVVAQRDSLHYQNQFLLAPQHIQTERVYWRLMPGVQAIAYEVPRSAGGAIYPTTNAYAEAWSPFSGIAPPAGWNDSPFYPHSSTTFYSLPGPKP